MDARAGHGIIIIIIIKILRKETQFDGILYDASVCELKSP